MFTQAKLIMQSYVAIELKKGMLFLSYDQFNTVSVYELQNDIIDEEQVDAYVAINGYPVSPSIIIEGNPNVPEETFIIATSDEIGWLDEGEHSDELHDITLKEINNILENGGYCEIGVEEQHLDDSETQVHKKPKTAEKRGKPGLSALWIRPNGSGGAQ